MCANLLSWNLNVNELWMQFSPLEISRVTGVRVQEYKVHCGGSGKYISIQ